MSRYTATVPGANLELAWGYDRPLCEYFVQAFDAKEEEYIFAVSSVNTLTPHPKHPDKMMYSNGEILEIMEEYPDQIPEDHRLAVTLDIPF